MVLVLSPEGEEGSSGCGDAAASLGDELDFFFSNFEFTSRDIIYSLRPPLGGIFAKDIQALWKSIQKHPLGSEQQHPKTMTEGRGSPGCLSI